MKELSRHIEVLLLDNDCVIVPGLGGFIAHYIPAEYREEEETFYPPRRIVGFNPKLTINDGLLSQFYMQTHHTDFPDATRMIEASVRKLKKQLHAEGSVTIPAIGTIKCDIHGSYDFTPERDEITTPSLYCFEPFAAPVLKTTRPETKEIALPRPAVRHSASSRSWMGYAAAAVIAIVMFFAYSAPVENSYVDSGSYACLGTDNLLEDLRNVSLAMSAPEIQKPRKVKTVTIKKTEAAKDIKKAETKKTETKKAETKKAETKKAETKETIKKEDKKTAVTAKKQAAVPSPEAKYYIIIASLPTKSAAVEAQADFRNAGCPSPIILESDGRYRIAYAGYARQADAARVKSQINKEEIYRNAWIYKKK